MRLQGKVVVITGAGTGIGQASALRCGREGARVTVLDINEAAGRETERALLALGAEAKFIRTDVISEVDWEHALAAVDERHGRLDVLVNNVGSNLIKATTEITAAEWDQLQALNVRSAFLGVKHAIPSMRRGGGGAIVNISSAVGLRSFSRMAAYGASKAAVVALTRQLAVEYAAEDIRVNCVCPGPTLTPRVKGYLQRGQTAAEDILRITPMRRFAEPDEIAAAVVFLASDEASYITGAVLAADGGQSAL
jgi:NAD(P)-dependent dehydrogenase (short-subunit alcohol dehydrogenase family)